LAPVLEMEIGRDIAEVGRVLDAIESFGAENRLSPAAIARLGLVVDELLTNVIGYAFAGLASDETPLIRLRIALSDGLISLRLTDNGKPFDPTTAPLPEIAGTLDEARIGGLGLRFVRNYADRLDYLREGSFNRLDLTMTAGRGD
jgi:serine/threonine-protein kinase RsbW